MNKQVQTKPTMKTKNPHFSSRKGGLLSVAGTGFEPVTSGL